MSFRADQTWFGAGAKVGGIALIGAETFEGVATRLDSASNPWREVNVTNVRLGVGLGGSVGLTVFVGFNMALLEWAEGTPVTDWGLNIAIPQVKVGLDDLRWAAALDSFLDGSDFLADYFISTMKNSERLGAARDFASLLWSTDDAARATRADEPTVLLIDVPGVGWGAEISLFASGGEFSAGPVIA